MSKITPTDILREIDRACAPMVGSFTAEDAETLRTTLGQSDNPRDPQAMIILNLACAVAAMNQRITELENNSDMSENKMKEYVISMSGKGYVQTIKGLRDVFKIGLGQAVKLVDELKDSGDWESSDPVETDQSLF